jgi:hypothetical protein
MKFCPYCGNPVKETDKFCIICGKPLLTNIAKPKQSVEIKENKKDKEIIIEKVEKKETEKKSTEEEEIDMKTKVKEEEKVKKKKEKKEVRPLPEDVKEQIDLYIEYNEIQINKKVLIDKLDEISKLTKDPRYEWDQQYKKEVNIKLEAVKTLIEESKQKEVEIKRDMEEPFIVQKINSDIDAKVFQLENLTREYKLHKVDKETFEKLREKYKQEKAELESDKEDLVSGMKLWIQELKLEKAELSSERKVNKGRFSAKEISEEEYQENDKEFDLKLKKSISRLETLEKLAK